MTNYVTRKLLNGFIFAFVVSFAFTPMVEAQIDEVIVTARKRDENLQEVPISITALSAETIEERQLFTVGEVAQYVPNLQHTVSAAGVASAATFIIRGIGQLDFITTTDSGVGVYLDGVYLARVQGSALDLADVERVEVLRGPQGTLFGRNTIGGAVSVVTRKPGDEFGVRGHFTIGNNARVHGRAIIDVPLIDGVLASKFTVIGKSSNGYGTDIEPLGGEGNLGEDDDIAARAQFLWTPSDTAEFNLAIDWSTRSGTALPQGRIFFDGTTAAGMHLDDGGTNSVIGTNRNFEPSDLDKITVDTPMLDELDVFGISLIADFELGNMNLKSITAYRDQEAQNGQDFDGGRTPTINQVIDSEQEQLSQEFQLTGQTENGKMDWLLGVYYFEEEGTFFTDVRLLSENPPMSGNFGILPLNIDTDNETESYAVFAHANYQMTDKVSLAGGLRYTEETKSIIVNNNLLITNGRGEQTVDALTPKVSIDYQVHDDLLVYASYAQGFKSGGYNGRAIFPRDLAPFTEETSISYELGFKSDLFENRLRFNLAGFLNEYEDIQLTATTQDVSGDFIVITDNAGDMDLYGFEVEIEALPTDNLTVFSSASYVANDKLKTKEGFTLNRPGSPVEADTLPVSSKWMVNVGFEYIFPMNATFETKLGVDYAYQSGFYPQYNNSDIARQEGYGLLNSRIQFTPHDAGWSLTLWGKNLRDEVYRTFGQDAAVSGIPVVVGFFAPTREYGATFSFSF